MKATTFDKAGATASTICAVHCVAVPLLFAALPVLGLSWLDNPWIDRSFLVLAVLFVVLAHPRGYLRHRNCVPALLALAGLAGISVAVSLWEGSAAHHWLVAAGGLTVAGSHWLNRHLLHAPSHCDHKH
jgi:chromate transport protein ChrA